jgi:hypothetical protein
MDIGLGLAILAPSVSLFRLSNSKKRFDAASLRSSVTGWHDQQEFLSADWLSLNQ